MRGDDCFKTARRLEIMGSNDGTDWEELGYRFVTPYNLIFEKEKEYTWYKLRQTGTDDRHSWAICDLGLLKKRVGSEIEES